jgi:hypothetical protein
LNKASGARRRFDLFPPPKNAASVQIPALAAAAVMEENGRGVSRFLERPA